MIISRNVYNRIRKFFCNAPIESGGIIGGTDDVIMAFYPDITASCKVGEYIPDIAVLNKIIVQWQSIGISFAGIIHSHPNGQRMLSLVDKEYGLKIVNSCRLAKLYMPVVTYEKNNVEITSYVLKNIWADDVIEVIE